MNSELSWSQSLRVLQIVSGAMIAAVTGFGVIGLVLASGNPADGYLVSVLGAATAMISLIVGGAASKLTTDNALRQKPADQRSDVELLSLFTTKHVARVAILEAAAFFNIIAYMLESNVWSIGFAAGIVALMGMDFPTEIRVQRWIGNQRLTPR